MMKSSTLQRPQFGGLLFLCLVVFGAAARSIESEHAAEHDPLMALPSDDQQHQSYYNQQQQQPPTQEVRYVTTTYQAAESQPAQHQEVVLEYQPAAAVAAENHAADPHQQPQMMMQQQPQQGQAMQVIYIQPQAQAQVAQQQQQQQELRQVPSVQMDLSGAPMGAGEQVARNGGVEYPGEIVYVGQNGQMSDGRDGALNNVAESLEQNSGLAATILTEIPVKDMPHEVLTKLKREYGVKVVATRERPGANLVINCDEYSANQESSVCNKQRRPQYQMVPQVAIEAAQRHSQPQPIIYEYQGPDVQHHQQQAQFEQHTAQEQHQQLNQLNQYQRHQPQSANIEYHQQEQPQQQQQHSQMHDNRQVQVIHINHETEAQGQEGAYAPAGHAQQGAQVQVHSHRGVMEVVQQPQPQHHHQQQIVYQQVGANHEQQQQQQQHGQQQQYHQDQQSTTMPMSNNGEQQHYQQQQHQQQPQQQQQQQNEYQGAPTTVAAFEQPTETVATDGHMMPVEQTGSLEQQAGHGQITSAQEAADQNAGFDDPAKSEHGAEQAYRPQEHHQ